MNDEGGYGRFGAYSRVELERFFHLDDEDRRLVAARRRDYNRLDFASAGGDGSPFGHVSAGPARCGTGAGGLSRGAARHR
ncbi:DUF4158 domain-containing protein [Rhodococcus qingshengii]|uniref:DUF4158 domain-containing protein n=1 Tax=Rhodococcus qingshengii TaxID=334542 RepID=UPI003D28B895